MTHKTNRVHKATGWIAKFSEVNNEWFLYETASVPISNIYIPAEIVEGEGWEDEKSEIDELISKLNGIVGVNITLDDPFKTTAKILILEFAKNYKG